jgi:Xaa-Pro aminopeptidase
MTRAERIVERLEERELDGLLVTGLVNVRWLTGFSGSNGLALVGAGDDGVRLFLTDFR